MPFEARLRRDESSSCHVAGGVSDGARMNQASTASTERRGDGQHVLVAALSRDLLALDSRLSARIQEMEERVGKALLDIAVEVEASAILRNVLESQDTGAVRGDKESDLRNFSERLSRLEERLQSGERDHIGQAIDLHLALATTPRGDSRSPCRGACAGEHVGGCAPVVASDAASGGVAAKALEVAALGAAAGGEEAPADKGIVQETPPEVARKLYGLARRSESRLRRAKSEASGEAVEFATLTSKSKSAERYYMKESVWDVSLFTGYRHMGIWVNILLGLSLCLNISIQVALCTIVASELSVDPYDDSLVQGLKKWRQNKTDVVVQQVCEEDMTLTTDSLQAQTYAAVKDFIAPHLWEQVETGPLLASLVIFMWTLSVSEVLRGAFDFLMAVRQLHQQKKSNTFLICHRHVRGEDAFSIQGVTCWRICWATFVGILQLGIAFSMLLSGALWLAYTKSIPDLLANAVALSYVMQLDELLYTCFVPRKVKAIVASLEPVDMSKSVSRHGPAGVPKKALLSVCFAFIFYFCIVAVAIAPHASRMREIRDDMCPPP